MGRLSVEKGVETLLDAWDTWGPSGFELVLIGDGRLGPALRRRLPPGVRLTGSLPREAVLAYLRLRRDGASGLLKRFWLVRRSRR